MQWLRVLGRVIGPHDVDKSPLVQVTKAKTIDIRFAKPIRYELDGGARKRRTGSRSRCGQVHSRFVCRSRPSMHSRPSMAGARYPRCREPATLDAGSPLPSIV